LSAGSATYTHTATGEWRLRVVGPDTTRYAYDAFGNLRDVYLPSGTHVQYAVDAQQRRTARIVNGVVTHRWLYQSQLAIAAEVDSAGTPVRTFTYALHGNVPELMTLANGRQYRLITDHLGSVRLVTDVTADTVVQRLDYDAWGNVLRDTRPGFQPWGYAGGLYDPLTGLVRFGARDYDAATGRWTAKDPMGFDGGSPNRYEYSAGQPTGIVDQDGRRIEVMFHEVAAGYVHTSIRITPTDQARYRTDYRFVGAPGSRYLTISAGPTLGCGGLLGRGLACLTAERNRDTDLGSQSRTGLVFDFDRCEENRVIEQLLRALAAYQHNSGLSPVNYDLFGGGPMPGSHNSNSFVSGMLLATGLITTTSGHVYMAPGWGTPVEARYYR